MCKHRPLCLLFLTFALLCACQDHLTEEDFKKNNVTQDDFFSFSTVNRVSLNLDYGDLCARALVRVYDENPVLEKDGRSVLNTTLNPLYQQFTDNEGRLQASFMLPAHVTEGVWLYSDFMCMPLCEYCEILDGNIYNWTYQEPVTRAEGTTRTVENPTMYSFDGQDDYYTIVKWSNGHGKLNDYNEIVSDGDLTSAQLTAIKQAVWNGQSTKPSSLDNSQYAVKGTEWINTTIRKNYRDADGKIQPVENAEVFFTFVQESGWNMNTVGYYYYPADQEPDSPDGLKKFIILPNASISGNAPYGANGFVKDLGTANAPLTTNLKVQLLYEQEDGTLTPNFPPNTTIGYFIIANAWSTSGSTKLTPVKAQASAPATRGETRADTYNLTLTVGESKSVQIDQGFLASLIGGFAKVTYLWESSNINVASVTGNNSSATIVGVNEGTATITAKKKGNKNSFETLATWNVTVTKSGSGTGGGGGTGGSDDDDNPSESLTGNIDFTQPIYYSNVEWNDGGVHCITRTANDYVIYGFEDGGDNSLEDVLFTISSTPKQAVIDPENPDIIDDEEVEEEKLTIGQRDFTTYCFEDLWPNLGDYDMNDVIIEHRSAMMFDNDNDLLEIRDSFTVCNEILSSGEGMKDAFAIRIPQDERGVMTLPSCAYDETETGSIILFDNAQEHLRETLVILREFDKGDMTIDQITRGLDLDPFIIPIWPNETITCKDKNRREVHFPKKSGTAYIDSSYYINTVEAYYVARDNKHAFAVSIPLPVAQTADEIAQSKKDGSMYIVASEMYEVDGQYAKPGHTYAEWVSSDGKSCTDWYKNYQISDAQQVERVEMNTKDITPKIYK